MPRRLTAPDPPLANERIKLVPMTHADRADLWRLALEPNVRQFTYVPSEATEDFVARTCGRADQHEITEVRHCLFQPDDYANCFLARVEIGAEQLDDALLLFQCLQQLTQTL